MCCVKCAKGSSGRAGKCTYTTAVEPDCEEQVVVAAAAAASGSSRVSLEQSAGVVLA